MARIGPPFLVALRVSARGGALRVFACVGLFALSAAADAETGYGGQPAVMHLTGGAAHEIPGTGIDVAYPREHPVHEPLVLECEVHSAEVYDAAEARLRVSREDGALAYQAAVPLRIREGANPVQFIWDVSALEPGLYTARLELAVHPGDTVAWKEVSVHNLAVGGLRARHAALSAQAEDLREHVDRVVRQGRAVPYAQMRMRIVMDTLALAGRQAEEGDEVHAGFLLQYVGEALSLTRGELLMAALHPERGLGVPPRGWDSLEARDGHFRSGGRPVFPIGLRVDAESPNLPDVLEDYSFNFLLGHATVQRAAAGRFLGMLDTAWDSGVFASLLLSSGTRSGEGEPFTTGAVDEIVGAVERLGAETRAHPALSSIGVRVRTAPEPEDSELADDFLEYVQDRYGTRHDMNWAWTTRLATFDDVSIRWDWDRPVYQYDLQTFYVDHITRRFEQLRTGLRRAAPEMPLYWTFPGDVFELGEARRGLDRGELADMTGITGVEAGHSMEHPDFALNYPDSHALFALLRSLAPNAPVLNTRLELMPYDAPLKQGNPRAYGRAALWESVMSGMSGAALTSWEATGPEGGYGLLGRPRLLEGAAAATLELNRAAEIVEAFQRAPAEVAILWSAPSQVFQDGDPYLPSALRAFDGASFYGYNVRFISESQCVDGDLDDVQVLIIPQALAVSNDAFAAIESFVEAGNMVVRTGRLIPYDASGQSRADSLRATRHTYVLRGTDTPTNYLHAMDAAYAEGHLPSVVRLVNRFGYPLEGVRSRYVEHEGNHYLYVINLRQAPVTARLYGRVAGGRDLLRGGEVRFPRVLQPLQPLLIRLDPDVEAPETPGPLEARGPHEAGRAFVMDPRDTPAADRDTGGVPTARVERVQ